MTLTDGEKKILKKLSETGILSTVELKQFLQDAGNGTSAMNTLINALEEKELITKIAPLGTTSLVITQKGTQMASDM